MEKELFLSEENLTLLNEGDKALKMLRFLSYRDLRNLKEGDLVLIQRIYPEERIYVSDSNWAVVLENNTKNIELGIESEYELHYITLSYSKLSIQNVFVIPGKRYGDMRFILMDFKG